MAKLDGNPPPMPPGSPDDPMIQALRALLAERFELEVHHETRQLEIYALTVASSDGRLGPALHRTTQDCQRLLDPRRGGPPPAPTRGSTVPCGVRLVGPGHVVAGGAPLSTFVNGLAAQVGRVVDDRTGLSGGWDFELTFAAEPGPGPLPPGADRRPPDPDAPSLFTALREQLGLKLEPGTGSVAVLVIDHVQRPTPD